MSTDKIAENRFNVPEHTFSAIKGYVEKGIPPGGFVRACLEDKFSEAIGRADHVNIRHLKEIATLLWNDVPGNLWGSEEAVNTHIVNMRERVQNE